MLPETFRWPVQLGWIPIGVQGVKPTRRLGLSEAENGATALALGDLFLREVLSG
jgi:hypothetical protein